MNVPPHDEAENNRVIAGVDNAVDAALDRGQYTGYQGSAGGAR